MRWIQWAALNWQLNLGWPSCFQQQARVVLRTLTVEMLSSWVTQKQLDLSKRPSHGRIAQDLREIAIVQYSNENEDVGWCRDISNNRAPSVLLYSVNLKSRAKCLFALTIQCASYQARHQKKLMQTTRRDSSHGQCKSFGWKQDSGRSQVPQTKSFSFTDQKPSFRVR